MPILHRSRAASGRPSPWRWQAFVATTSSLMAILFLLPGPASFAEAPACNDCHEVDMDAFAKTVHGGLECTDCHAAAAEVPHEEVEGLAADCSSCHDDIVKEYASSVHGRSKANGVAEAPDCSSCHGPVHELEPRDEPESKINPRHIADTCGACHADPNMIAKFKIPVAQPLEAYRASVHARMVAEGRGGATCSACHGSHAIYAASDPRSRVFHQKVPQTCAQCHEQIAEAYEASVHGVAAGHGAREAPVCTDCHGEHRILSPSEKGSPVYATNVPKMTCERCHGDLRLAEKYGLPSDKVEAYEDSYHGLAAKAGKVTVANCSSCHGVHDILPSTDSRSHVSPANLAATCGKCHPGAGETFKIGKVHVLPTEPEHAAVYWVRHLYLWMIYVVIGGMLLHNGMDLYRKVKNPPPPILRNGLVKEKRMSGGFRAAHGLLLLSFATLVYTGFALTYSDSWWAEPLLRWEEAGFGVRGWLHRAAAVVMLIAFAIHIVHLTVDRRARACIAGMRPRWEDYVEARDRMLWYVGRRPDPPHQGKLGYPEKMEYLALLWGMLVMAVTGILLWNENWLLRWLPKWVADLSTVIHFYEAVLASLAILVWHLYFVIFDPVVYPMDTAWLTGRSHPARVFERRLASHPAVRPAPAAETAAPGAGKRRAAGPT